MFGGTELLKKLNITLPSEGCAHLKSRTNDSQSWTLAVNVERELKLEGSIVQKLRLRHRLVQLQLSALLANDRQRRSWTYEAKTWHNYLDITLALTSLRNASISISGNPSQMSKIGRAWYFKPQRETSPHASNAILIESWKVSVNDGDRRYHMLTEFVSNFLIYSLLCRIISIRSCRNRTVCERIHPVPGTSR